MIRNLLNKESKTITSAAVVIAVASLTSRFLGLFRDRILASEIGTVDLNVYYAAFRIPDLVFNLLVLGALSAGFIPVFTQILDSKKKNNEAWFLANSIINIGVIFLVVLGALLWIFTPQIMRLMVPGFGAEKMKIVVALTRIMYLSPLFLGLSSVFGGILQSFKRFFVYSLAPIFYNLGIIIGALFFVNKWGLRGLAWGVVLGAFLHFLIQLPTVYHLGFRWQPVMFLKNRQVRRIGQLMIPRTLTLAVSQLNLVVIVAIASTLGDKEITIFNLANNLQSFPVGLFGVSLAIAAFPALSEYAASKLKFKKFIKTFTQTLRQILFFILPASVLLLVLRAQIVRVVLGAGKFGWEDTVLTLDTLGFFSLGLFAQGLLPLFVRGFYAFHNSKTPFFYGLISAVINIILCLVLVKPLGVGGLALAFSVSSIFNLLLLWIGLRLRVGDLEDNKTLASVSKVAFACFVMAIFVQGAKYFTQSLFGTETFFGVFMQGGLAGLVGVAVFTFVCLWLKSEEMITFINSLKRKFLKIKVMEEGIEESGEIK